MTAPRRTATALLDAGADVHEPDGAGDTPLTLALQRGYTETATARRDTAP